MVNDRAGPFLATAYATEYDRQQAFLAIAVLFVAFGVTVPWAQARVGALPQFVPLYDTAIVVLDTLAAALLYA